MKPNMKIYERIVHRFWENVKPLYKLVIGIYRLFFLRAKEREE